MDGYDISPILLGDGPNPRDAVYYYRGTRLMAVRHGPWKAHYETQGAYGTDARESKKHDPPLLFNLDVDPSERLNVNDKHPEVLAQIAAIVAAHRENLDPPPSQLEIPLKK